MSSGGYFRMSAIYNKEQHICVEVIISTYNNPKFLDLVLASLSNQSYNKFKICIADDGSNDETAKVIKLWRDRKFKNTIRHEWQQDKGFRKNIILNKAISSSDADYLIFIDGDCLAFSGFIERHLTLAKIGIFVSGGVVRLPVSTTNIMTSELIKNGSAFNKYWLLSNGVKKTISNQIKLGVFNLYISSLLETITPVKRTWNGGNSSAWRTDLLEVNGFNEDMKYGAEDVELGVRLNNKGIVGRHCRYSALLLHMEHDRNYADKKTINSNKEYIRAIRKTKMYWTNNGIKKERNNSK
jgi:glycosyltransferase involved in cell wall biosynthesis